MSADASSSGRRRSIDDPDSLIASTAPMPASSSASTAPAGDAAAAPSSDAGAGEGGDDDADEAEIAAMRARVAEMEAEAAKLRELTAASEAAANGGAASSSGAGGADGAGGEDVSMSDEDRAAVDARSIYVGNVESLPLRLSSLGPGTKGLTPGERRAGRLQLDARRDSATFRLVRDHQPRHHPL
jgi:polyadenylate-binding protein 2